MQNPDELLRANGILLLRREREVHQLRQERTRIETWINVFHKLSSNSIKASPELLLEQWVEAMVGELGFQVAGAYGTGDIEHRMQLLAGVADVPLPSPVVLTPAECDFMSAQASGCYSADAAGELECVAGALGLRRLHWLIVPLRERLLLLVAGFTRDASLDHSIDEREHRQFALLGSHIATLASNAFLIAELDREKSDLQQSNQKLDVNVRMLRDAQHDLVASSKRLAAVSRRAGMADIATGVLHNVGNALNSVNVSAEVLFDGLRKLKTSGVARAATLLRENSEDLAAFFLDPRRGAKLPLYLKELGEHLEREREELLKETHALKEHVEHIKAIVSKQQAYATSFDTSQPCVVSELVDDAIALSEHSLAKYGIVISRDFEPTPEIVVDRHKVLEILINLVKNAQDALLGGEQPLKRIIARCCSVTHGNVQIIIQDNGAGIAAEELDRLFAFGFTTKKGGHGFGLHASAVAAEELGGTLTAHSAGRGQGARFTLELPPRPKSGASSAA